MLRVSKLADYAVMVVLKFSQNPLHLYSATDLVSLTGLNLPTLRKVLKLLSTNGILKAKRGVEGGYVLVRNPSEISVLDVVEAIDGKLAFTECCEKEFKMCSVSQCQMSSHWHAINRKIRTMLSTFALEDLIHKPQNKEITLHV